MAEVIKGSQVAAGIKEKIRKVIDECSIVPCLGIVRVGNNPSDLAYEKGVLKTCSDVGIKVDIFELPQDIAQEEFDSAFRKINDNKEIDGILLFRPLPKGLTDINVRQIIDPAKDVDCMSPMNWSRLIQGESGGFNPCTAESVIRILDYAGTEYDGAKAVIIGRSRIIGKPVGLMLLAKNTTITWCHTKTRDIAAECKDAEILISACGVKDLVNEEMVKGVAPGCIAADVGVVFEDGKMYGDFTFEDVCKYAAKVTPVPGGVGAVTNTVLAAHVTTAAYRARTGRDIEI